MLATLPVEIIEAKPAIRRQQLRDLVPLADTTIYEMEQRGEFAIVSPCRTAKPKICFTISRTWIAVAGAPRLLTLLHSALRSSGVISVISRLFHAGAMSLS